MAELSSSIVKGSLRITDALFAKTIYENGVLLSTKYALSAHTHTLSLAADTGTSSLTLAYGGKYKLTAGDNSIIFTMPSADNTNTWRPVAINGTTKIASDVSTALNLKAGTNVSLSYSANDEVVIAATDTNTWRPIGTGATDACAGNDERLNNIQRLAWWTDNNGNNVDNLTYGTTFAYTSHNAPTVGTIVAFSCTYGTYQLQLQGSYYGKGLYYRNKNGDNGTWNAWERLANISDIPSWAQAANKPSYSFSGSAVTSGDNSGSAVAAVTAISGGSGSLTGDTTASGGIPYVEASLSGTELTLTVKYLHHSHTGASVSTTANAAPSGHTHSVTAAGSVS